MINNERHDEVVCPACQGARAGVVMDGCEDSLLGVPGRWSILECTTCRLKFTAPRPDAEELASYYPSSWHVYEPQTSVRESSAGNLIRSAAILPYRLRFGDPDCVVEPFGSRRFLDVGCGTGALLGRMAARGWTCTGIDFSATAVAAVRRVYPHVVVQEATLENFQTDQRFAMISMQHLLEHLPDPVEGLRRCRELLEPGGQLVISVPNIDSIEARVFGRRWMGIEIPRHLNHFARPTLHSILEAAGFEAIQMRPALFASTLSESLALALPMSLGRKLIGSRIGRLLYFATVFPACLSYVLGNEPVLEARCRRPAE